MLEKRRGVGVGKIEGCRKLILKFSMFSFDCLNAYPFFIDLLLNNLGRYACLYEVKCVRLIYGFQS